MIFCFSFSYSSGSDLPVLSLCFLIWKMVIIPCLQYLTVIWSIYMANHIARWHSTWGSSAGLLLPIVSLLYDCVFPQYATLGKLHKYSAASQINELMNSDSELPKRWTKSLTQLRPQLFETKWIFFCPSKGVHCWGMLKEKKLLFNEHDFDQMG